MTSTGLRVAVVLAIFLGGLVFVGVSVGGNVVGVEKRAYEAIDRDGPFSIRAYPPAVVAETFVQGDFDDVGSIAFRRLAGYIFGANRERVKIAMTAPVAQEASDGGGQKIAMTAPVTQESTAATGEGAASFRVTFTMPAEYTLETLPVPEDSRVLLRTEPGGRHAAVRYRGGWSRERYDRHLAMLEAWVSERGEVVVGEPVWARYDPPFMPWFLRHNEILLPLADDLGS